MFSGAHIQHIGFLVRTGSSTSIETPEREFLKIWLESPTPQILLYEYMSAGRFAVVALCRRHKIHLLRKPFRQPVLFLLNLGVLWSTTLFCCTPQHSQHLACRTAWRDIPLPWQPKMHNVFAAFRTFKIRWGGVELHPADLFVGPQLKQMMFVGSWVTEAWTVNSNATCGWFTTKNGKKLK